MDREDKQRRAESAADARAGRQARLAEALRANLKRRKTRGGREGDKDKDGDEPRGDDR
jgi:hypothetical protein